MDELTEHYLTLLSFLKENDNKKTFEEKRIAVMDTDRAEPESVALLSEDGETVTIIKMTKMEKPKYDKFPYTNPTQPC